MSVWWSYVLTTIGVTGLYLAGRHNRWGWGIGFGVQFLWLAYAITTEQWGFLIACFTYGWVNARNFLKWKREAVSKPVTCGNCVSVQAATVETRSET